MDILFGFCCMCSAIGLVLAKMLAIGEICLKHLSQAPEGLLLLQDPPFSASDWLIRWLYSLHLAQTVKSQCSSGCVPIQW